MRARRPLPTQDRLKELFHYNPDTGVFTRKVSRGRCNRWKEGQQCGTKSADGYINISVDYTIYRAHRLAWRYMTGEEPSGYGIDHVNRDGTDNRWINLREGTQSDNLCNRTHSKRSKLQTKGVYEVRSGVYVARIQKHGKPLYLGSFRSIPEAKAAYDAAAKVIHGGFHCS